MHGLLDFLRQALEKSAGANGVFLVLDEINGLANEPWFAQMIKSLVDTNALAVKPLPLLLMICGTEEKRRRMIENHQPVERIFDVIDIEPLSEGETREFFHRAFDLAGTKVTDEGMRVLTLYSAGFPKIMHLIGDWAYWTDQDLVIDERDAIAAVGNATEDFGRRYVDQQVLAALKSQDYRSILSKITNDVRFLKQDVEQELDDSERKKFNNFLHKMKTLNVLRSGTVKGEYVFNMNLVRLYLFLQRAKLARKDELHVARRAGRHRPAGLARSTEAVRDQADIPRGLGATESGEVVSGEGGGPAPRPARCALDAAPVWYSLTPDARGFGSLVRSDDHVRGRGRRGRVLEVRRRGRRRPEDAPAQHDPDDRSGEDGP